MISASVAQSSSISIFNGLSISAWSMGHWRSLQYKPGW